MRPLGVPTRGGMAEEKRIAIRWLTSWASAYSSMGPGDVELVDASKARGLLAAGHVELVEADDRAPERRVMRKRETR